MSCQDHERDLLLLHHGELGPVRRFATEVHLRHCERCRQRRARFGTLSAGMADAIRGERMPRWRAPAPVRLTAPTGLQWAIAAVIASLLILGASATLTASPLGLSHWFPFGHESDTNSSLYSANCPAPVDGKAQVKPKPDSGSLKQAPKPKAE